MKPICLYLSSVLVALFLGLSSVCAQDVVSVSPSYSLRDDGDVELIFDVEVAEGWYIYSASVAKGGPMPAEFFSDGSSSFSLVGKLSDVGEAHSKFDEAFGMDVLYFEGSARFVQVVHPSAEGDFIVAGTFSCQSCNGAECLINESDVSVAVSLSGVGVSESSIVPEGTAEKGGQSLWVFLLIAFAAGLGGVVTPCVFPMIPMTVGFLIGGGSSKRAGVVKGVVFGLSVILIYTLLGLVVSLFESTAATDALGTHWIPNLIFALLFLVFAVSFLGAFEITLPSGLANKADRQADKGGYLAAFFVALAMVIVSFSCTGPFVGSILAAAVMGGVALKPILGMAVFGLAFALPFVLFSFFPGVMKKLPKSGGWLNVVKVVFAFVLLGFAMKFLYNVDAYFGWGIVTRFGVLCVWIALVLLLGLYCLGVFRTSHDSPSQGIGWGRVVIAIACFAFAFYLIPGLFGAPLKSVSGVIPPQDGSTFVIASGNDGAVSGNGGGYAQLEGFSSVEKALENAKLTGKPVLLSFKSHTCSVCKVMEATVLSDPQVLSALRERFVVANLYVDDRSADGEFKTLGRRLRDYQLKNFGSASQPLYVVVDGDGSVLSGPVGSCSLEEFLSFLNF